MDRVGFEPATSASFLKPRPTSIYLKASAMERENFTAQIPPGPFSQSIFFSAPSSLCYPYPLPLRCQLAHNYPNCATLTWSFNPRCNRRSRNEWEDIKPDRKYCKQTYKKSFQGFDGTGRKEERA
jgi:hypothetical protein